MDSTGIAAGQNSAAGWKRLIPFLSFGLAAFCLWWVVREIDLDQLRHQISSVQPGWLALAVVFDVLAYAAQGVRWRLLLAPVGNLPVVAATRFIYAGLFANELLPLRPGEVLRGWLAGRELSASPIAIAPSILIERMIDGFWLALALLLLARSVPLPPGLSHAVTAFMAVMACLLPAAIALRPALARLRLAHRWRLARNLRFLPDNAATAGAWLFSAVILVCQGLSFWFAMNACGIGLSLPRAFGVLLIVRIGTLIPGAPANLGTFQFAAVLGLMLFGISKEVAAPFSMILFAALTLPLWALGAAAMAQAGVSLAGIRRRAIEAPTFDARNVEALCDYHRQTPLASRCVH